MSTTPHDRSTDVRPTFDLRMLDTIITATDECPPHRADYRWLRIAKGMLEAQAFGLEVEVPQ